jgi:protein arginine kinase
VNSLRDYWLKRQSWEEGLRSGGSVVLRSALHLSRNLQNVPFPERLGPMERKEISEKIMARVRRTSAFRGSLCLELGILTEDERMALQEWCHIATMDPTSYDGSYLLLVNDGSASLWICGNHHICWNLFGGDLCLKGLWKQVSRWESSFADLKYAFSPVWGYLASDLEEWGSGLCVSVTLHIPAIVESGCHDEAVRALRSLGLKWCSEYRFVSLEFVPVIKIFHDGSSKISLKAKEALLILQEAVLFIADKERDLRNRLLKKQKLKIWDRVSRSWGTLFSCRLLSASEALYCLSNLRLGVDFGWCPERLRAIIDYYARHLLRGTLRMCAEMENPQIEQEEADRAQYVKKFATMENLPIFS